MHLEVTFRNLKPREEVRRRARALYSKLERFLDPAAEGVLVIGVEGGQPSVDITVTTRGRTHQCTENDDDLRTAIDRAFHTMETTLRRAKERRLTRRHQGADVTDGFTAEVAVDDDAAEPASA